MNKISRILTAAALAAGFVGASASASAAGLLGQRYAGALFDLVDFDEDFDEGLGGTLVLNQPLTPNVDLMLNASTLGFDVGTPFGDVDLDWYQASFAGTYILPPVQGAWKPYVRTGLGWARVEGVLPNFGAKAHDSDWFYSIEVGLEVPVTDSIAVTPYAAWSDGFDDALEGTWDFGVLGEASLSTDFSLLARINRNDEGDMTYSGGVAFRF